MFLVESFEIFVVDEVQDCRLVLAGVGPQMGDVGRLGPTFCPEIPTHFCPRSQNFLRINFINTKEIVPKWLRFQDSQSGLIKLTAAVNVTYIFQAAFCNKGFWTALLYSQFGFVFLAKGTLCKMLVKCWQSWHLDLRNIQSKNRFVKLTPVPGTGKGDKRHSWNRGRVPATSWTWHHGRSLRPKSRSSCSARPEDLGSNAKCWGTSGVSHTCRREAWWVSWPEISFYN